MKLPPMKSDFISRKNFFRRPSDDRIDLRKPIKIERQRLSDNKGTNTLTYSDTNHDGLNKHSSDYQTVFKFTDRNSKGDEEEGVNDLDLNQNQGSNSKVRHSVPVQVTKSQHLNGRGSLEEQKGKDGISKSNFLDSKVSNKDNVPEITDEPQDVSENIGEKELKELYERKQKLIPEYKCSWFQFHTEAIYCNVSSLCFVRSGIGYDVPFAVAKIILKSKSSLLEFLSHCDFVTNIGTLIFDYLNLEEIKTSTSFEDQDFETDFVEVKGDKIYIEYPLARVWDRYSKVWTHKLLDLEELNSIDPHLSSLDLVGSDN